MKIVFFILFICQFAFSETVPTPNMSLPVPVVGTTLGPDWANDINACMSTIDSHDHTPGKGVQIVSAALNINADLPMNDNSLTSVKDVQFTSQLTDSTTQAIYSINPDLYFTDGNGNVIRITQNGSVAGATGTITGLPSGTASASYQSGSGTFQFQSATSTPANGSFASLSIAPQTASSNAITLKTPSPLSASYNVTFPAAVPSATSLITMGTSGTLALVPYRGPTQQRFTGSSGTYTTPTSPSPLYLKVRMIGGGAGGGACTTNNGSNGGTSLFASNICSGGLGGGSQSNNTGSGGSCVIGTGVGTTVAGGAGNGGFNSATNGGLGGMGGISYFGGPGLAGSAGGASGNAVASTTYGAGGSGAGCAGSAGGGGGAGGFLDVYINSPAASYSYTVAGGGNGGTPGSASGGNGAPGYIEVTEFYQ